MMGLIYGSIHLGAWNAPFRNKVEQLLWRISSSLVAGIGILFSILHLFVEKLAYSERLMMRQAQVNRQRASKEQMLRWRSSSGVNYSCSVSIRNRIILWLKSVCLILESIITLVLLTTYVAARAYLIVECFSSLFHSPPEVFEQPSFSSYFPHFGSG
jgi:hypothetical protein